MRWHETIKLWGGALRYSEGRDPLEQPHALRSTSGRATPPQTRSLTRNARRVNDEESSAMTMIRSSRHSKITDDFAEALVLYWLSKSGCECATVDHTGIDLIASKPASGR